MLQVYRVFITPHTVNTLTNTPVMQGYPSLWPSSGHRVKHQLYACHVLRVLEASRYSTVSIAATA